MPTEFLPRNHNHMDFDDSSIPETPECKLLFVEDDREMAALIKSYLEKSMISVSVETRGDRAVARAIQESPDVILLDLMLPGKDGMSICRELRAANLEMPIIIYTARDETYDEVLGLELGADEYIVKPAEPRVLLARIRAVLRRSKQINSKVVAGEVLQFQDLVINRLSRSVTAGEIDVPISAADFDLLWFLACNAGRVMSRDDILSSLRGLNYDGVSRSVDTRISRLRKRLEEVRHDNIIKTVRPQGYLFSIPSKK
jgi:two-component system, OmpR family, response regulator RstA